MNTVKKSVLIAANDPGAIEVIRNCLHKEYDSDIASNLDELLDMFGVKRYEFVFVDLFLLAEGHELQNGSVDYKSVFKSFFNIYVTAQIIVMAPQEKTRGAVNAVKAGASDYLTYPIDPEEVKYVTENTYEAVRLQSELDYLRDKFWKSDSLDVIRTRSAGMKNVFDKVKSVAPTKTTVLLTGETGTGKNVVAKLIHRHSNRCDNQFINVHCGAIPDTLIESELFGHEKGAFTGATRRKLGKFEIAHRGTILLDEIGTITPAVQIKLLRVIQEKTFNRVGGESDIKTDVRIITASNVDLKKNIDQGSFRSDLYYRLSVFPIEIPPLKERKEDIELLVVIFLEELNKFYNKRIHGVHRDVMDAFDNYDWPGNIRELENLIERAYILENSTVLTPESFPGELLLHDGTATRISLDTSNTLAQVRRSAMQNVEKSYLRELLANNKGKINATALAAGISTRQLSKLLKKYRIHKEDFKDNSKSE